MEVGNRDISCVLIHVCLKSKCMRVTSRSIVCALRAQNVYGAAEMAMWEHGMACVLCSVVLVLSVQSYIYNCIPWEDNEDKAPTLPVP